MMRLGPGELAVATVFAVVLLCGCSDDSESTLVGDGAPEETAPAHPLVGRWSITSVDGESYAVAAREVWQAEGFAVGFDSDWTFYENGTTRVLLEWTFIRHLGKKLPADWRMFYRLYGDYADDDSSCTLTWEEDSWQVSQGLRELGFGFETGAKVVRHFDVSSSGTWEREGEHLTLHWDAGGETVLLR